MSNTSAPIAGNIYTGNLENTVVFFTNLLEYLKAVKVRQFSRLADLEDMCANEGAETNRVYYLDDDLKVKCTGSRQTPAGVVYYFEMVM